MHVLNTKEVQLGLIILFVFYFGALFSGLDLGMMYSHEMISYIAVGLLIALLFNLKIVVDTPHRGRLVLNSKNDTWFISAYNMLFFILIFTVCTLISSLIAYALHVDRSQDIFTIGMLITNIYYVLVSLWTCYNFIAMSSLGDNMEFEEKRKKI